MAELEPLLAELRRIADVVGPALLRASHGDLLQSVADTARHLLDGAACSLALLEQDQAHLLYVVASGVGAESVVGLRLPVNQGIAGWVAVSGQPMSVSDVQNDPRFARGFAQETGYVPTSLLAMPMQTERRVVGVLTVLDAAPETGMDLLSSFAHQAAIAIESGQAVARTGELLLSAAASATDGRLRDALYRAAEAGPSEPGDVDESLIRQVMALVAAPERDRLLASELLGVLLRRGGDW